MAFISVLFPAPLVPINPTISSAPTSKETSCTAVLPPNRTVMLLHRERGYTGRHGRALGRSDRARERLLLGCRRRPHRVARPCASSASRAEYATWMNPPGKNMRITSRPTLDVSSGTRSLLGKNAGSPITHSAPRIGPGDGAQAADHHDRHEQERVLDAEVTCAAARSAASRRAARPRGRRSRRRARTCGASPTSGSTV